MKPEVSRFQVVTVTLNPAVDQTVTVPGFATGKVNRATEVRSCPGGKGVNVASALADYGCKVAATGFLGIENSAPFEEMLVHKRIGDHFVRIKGATRTGIKIIDPTRQVTTDINLPGLSPGDADMNLLQREIDHLDAVWCVLGGSVPPEIDQSIYAGLIASFKAKGCKVLLDTSGEPLISGIEAVPQIIKPNIHELEALTGKSISSISEVIDAARPLIGRGMELVAVSMGGEGACFVTADETITARPPAVEVKSTVGAGDAMVAGIIAAQLAGLPIGECARLATAFSLDVLSRGYSGITSRGRIQEWMEKVIVSRVQ